MERKEMFIGNDEYPSILINLKMIADKADEKCNDFGFYQVEPIFPSAELIRVVLEGLDDYAPDYYWMATHTFKLNVTKEMQFGRWICAQRKVEL